jgi:hypothetical protein
MQIQPPRQADTNEGPPMDEGNRPAGALSEVVVHINKALDGDRRDDFEQALRDIRGVLDLSFCRTRHHLVIVQYLPEIVSSVDLIGHVRRLAGQAQLVGPI